MLVGGLVLRVKKTLFSGLHFLILFLISSCGFKVSVTPKIVPGASNVFSPVSVSSPAYINSTLINLSYGNTPSDYLEYCLLENNTSVESCTWVAGTLPSTFLIDATEEVKVISAWIRNLEKTSERVDSNPIVFDTTNPVLNLTSLNSAESFLGGAVAVVTWTGSDLNSGTTPMRIEYSSDNGTSWNVVVNGVSNSGTYNWTLPSVTSKQYLVRLTMTDLAGNFLTNISSTPFWVNASSPGITVTAANGGEVYRGGSVQNITWTTSGLPAGAATIKLEYTTDGTTFNLISTGELNDGTYAWTTPVIDSASVRIRATVTDSFSVETSDLSNANFTIDSTAPATPNGLTLQTPSSSPGMNATPVIRVSVVVSGDLIELFSHSSCTTSIGSTTAAGVTADVTSSALSEGVATTFYAKATDPVGNASGCSTANVSYTYDNTAPNAATSLGWLESSPFNGTTVTAAWIKSNSAELSNQKIQFYTNSSCTTTSGSLIDLASNSTETRSFSGSYGTTYYYNISSFDAAGNSSTSSCSSAMALNSAPVASNLLPNSFNEDTAQAISLVYNDSEGDSATTCSVSNLSNITASACSCNLGSCSVTVTGTSNYNGPASFDYTVTAGGVVSNTASAAFTITAVNDAPTISDISNQAGMIGYNTPAISFTIVDIDSPVSCASNVSKASSNTTVLPVANITIGGGATQNCTVTLNAASLGNSTVSLTVTDSFSATTSDSFLFTATVSQTFSHTGADQSFVVPANCFNITAKAWGAGGGGAGIAVGGGGGFAQATFAVTTAESLIVRVGGGGGGFVGDRGSGGGGGAAAVYRSSTPLIIAGAGGGAGGSWAGVGGGAGGHGGGLTGGSGGTSTCAGGGGGTQSAIGTTSVGGICSLGSAGAPDGSFCVASEGDCYGHDFSTFYSTYNNYYSSYHFGYLTSTLGGGGGNGYNYGRFGAGNNSSQTGAGGGGGGSSYTTGSSTLTLPGSGQNAANTSDPDYVSPAGRGGNAQTIGEHGLIVISCLSDSTPPGAPTSVVLGSTHALNQSPTISWTAPSDASGIGSHQVELYKTSDNSMVQPWTTLTSGSRLTGLSLDPGTQYYVRVRAIDNAGNIGTSYGTSTNWTAAACTPGSQVFNHTGAAQTFSIPAHCSSITVKAWGGGGGGAGVAAGGGAGFAQGTLTVNLGETLNVVVAGGGGGVIGDQGGGGGGGASAVQRGFTALIIAAGGGGAGGSWLGVGGGAGGPGGGINGVAGTSSICTGGGGATASAGGAGGITDGICFWGGSGGTSQGGPGFSSYCEDCQAYNGGANGWGYVLSNFLVGWSNSGGAGGPGMSTTISGGGGGGGYFGGGGGAGNDSSLPGAGGGGGGSSYSTGQSTTLTAGSARNAGNNGDPSYANSAGEGGSAMSDGNPGRIVISW
jgi:hypothetical protein